MRLKFEDCATCIFRRKPSVCRDCDVGELYEDEDRPGVDMAFYEPSTRFGESVSGDEDDRPERPNLDRIAEELSGNDDDGEDLPDEA